MNDNRREKYRKVLRQLDFFTEEIFQKASNEIDKAKKVDNGE